MMHLDKFLFRTHLGVERWIVTNQEIFAGLSFLRGDGGRPVPTDQLLLTRLLALALRAPRLLALCRGRGRGGRIFIAPPAFPLLLTAAVLSEAPQYVCRHLAAVQADEAALATSAARYNNLEGKAGSAEVLTKAAGRLQQVPAAIQAFQVSQPTTHSLQEERTLFTNPNS